MSLLRRVLAEALGTFGLVFVCAGSVVATAVPGTDFGLLGAALAQAAALSVMVSATMKISGAHLNPAVTVGFLATRRTTPADAGAYILAQLAGAVVAAWVVKALMPDAAVAATSLGTPALQNGVTFARGVAIEAVLTFLLMSAVYGTAVAPTAPAVGGFGIGTVLLFDILVGGNLTGAAMNPARAFGPAAIGGQYLSHAVYWIGPVVGAVAAALVWEKGLIERGGGSEGK
jgi:MIP family channel proteins